MQFSIIVKKVPLIILENKILALLNILIASQHFLEAKTIWNVESSNKINKFLMK